MGHNQVLQPTKDKTNTGPITGIVLFCHLYLPMGKAHNPHKLIHWVWELRENKTREYIANLSTATQPSSGQISVKYYIQRQQREEATKKSAPRAVSPLLKKSGSNLPNTMPALTFP